MREQLHFKAFNVVIDLKDNDLDLFNTRILWNQFKIAKKHIG